MNWSYYVYGLRLCSDVPIPGIRAVSAEDLPDVRIRAGQIPAEWSEARAGDLGRTYLSPNRDSAGVPILEVFRSQAASGFLFRYCDGVKFVVDGDGTRIWFEWPGSLTVEDAATYLLGPVLGFVLRLRGRVCLHASAIAAPDGAVALVGTNGAGKSTAAAWFASLGYRVLSDDLLPLRREGEIIIAESGYPRIRLWPDSVQDLYGPERELPPLTPTWDKRYLDLSGAFQHGQVPLNAIYILAPRAARPEAPSIQELSRSEAFLELITNTYCNYLLDASMRAQEFDFLGDLLDRVPVRRIVPDSEARASERLCSLILDESASLRPFTTPPQNAPSTAY